MALSANASYKKQHHVDVGQFRMVVKNSSVIYNGALVSFDSLTGEVKPFDGTQGDRLAGFHFGDSVTGDSSASPRPKATICPGGFTLRNVTVGGLADDATDYGAPVYPTDDGTFTITDPGDGVAIGHVLPNDDRDSGKANVYVEIILGKTSRQTGIFAKELTFTETGEGTYTGTVVVPAGATIVDIIVENTALWDAATSASLIVGDDDDPDGYFAATDLKATDLLADQTMNFDKTGGQEGAYLVGTATHWTNRYSAAARNVIAVITTSGAGTAGRTRVTVIYSVPDKTTAVTAA